MRTTVVISDELLRLAKMRAADEGVPLREVIEAALRGYLRLVYARREESVHHVAAHRLVRDLAEGQDTWAIPWPCVYEFLRVVTHPKVFDPPTRLDAALEDLESLFDCPSLVFLGEGLTHGAHLLTAIREGKALGNRHMTLTSRPCSWSTA